MLRVYAPTPFPTGNVGVLRWCLFRRFSHACILRPKAGLEISSYRRVLATAVDIEEFERVVREYFGAMPRAGRSMVIAVDGKTLRGTIPTEHTHGRHLLAAYVPAEGWVLSQVEVAA
jgi:hypothetical protein